MISSPEEWSKCIQTQPKVMYKYNARLGIYATYTYVDKKIHTETFTREFPWRI